MKKKKDSTQKSYSCCTLELQFCCLFKFSRICLSCQHPIQRIDVRPPTCDQNVNVGCLSRVCEVLASTVGIPLCAQVWPEANSNLAQCIGRLCNRPNLEGSQLGRESAPSGESNR